MIYVIIPVHNRRKLTQRCLQCLQEQTYKDIKTILIDDGSSDGTSEMVRTNFPSVKVINGDGNLWWAEAVNVGVRYALEDSSSDRDMILTLNDDTEFNTVYIQSLIDVYEQFNPCLVGSVCVDINSLDKLEYAGSRLELNWAKWHNSATLFNNSYKKLLSMNPKIIDSDSLPGRGTLIPISIFKQVGLYDSVRFRQYMADIEFSVRCNKIGLPLYVSTESVVHGHIDATGIQVEKKVPLGEFIKGFISIRSSTNVKIRYHFAMIHSNTKLLYFILDMGRVVVGYLFRRLKISV